MTNDATWARDLPYFPTVVGDTWVAQTGDWADLTTTRSVTAVREVDGAKVVTVSAAWRGNANDLREELEVTASDTGIFARHINVIDNQLRSDRVCLLQLPVKVGQRWDFHVSAIRGFVSDRKGHSTLTAEEEIEVPAGRFKSVRVDTEYSDKGGASQKRTTWYARGVGEVKRVYAGGHTVLAKFTRGSK